MVARFAPLTTLLLLLMTLVASLSERLLTAWIVKTREMVFQINMILLLQFLKDELIHFDINSDFIHLLQHNQV